MTKNYNRKIPDGRQWFLKMSNTVIQLNNKFLYFFKSSIFPRLYFFIIFFDIYYLIFINYESPSVLQRRHYSAAKSVISLRSCNSQGHRRNLGTKIQFATQQKPNAWELGNWRAFEFL